MKKKACYNKGPLEDTVMCFLGEYAESTCLKRAGEDRLLPVGALAVKQVFIKNKNSENG